METIAALTIVVLGLVFIVGVVRLALRERRRDRVVDLRAQLAPYGDHHHEGWTVVRKRELAAQRG